MTSAPRRAYSRWPVWPWFSGLAWQAKAGIITAAVVTMSAGVLIGVPPSRVPWLAPTVAPHDTVETPSVLKPSMVQAVTPGITPSAPVRTVTTQPVSAAVSLTGPSQG